ncbi:sporulation protein [Priestia megaterium]|nr:sporulation protein [Priestia megaterium]
MKIFFKYAEDAMVVYQSLCAKRSALSYAPQCFKLVNSQLLVIDVTYSRDEVVHDMVIPVLTQFILKYKEQHLLTRMLKEQFFYSDEEEQQQIIELVHALMGGEKAEIPQKTFTLPRDLLITEALQDFLVHNVTFTLESFLQFRLKEYHQRLQYYLELSIDEYKLEQDYQMFIHQLRQIVDFDSNKMSEVYVVHEQANVFRLYNHQLCQVSTEERAVLAQQFVSQYESLYIDTTIIAPLIALSPKKIYLYTDDGSHHDFIYTIQNIFQENVILCDKKEATFTKTENIT